MYYHEPSARHNCHFNRASWLLLWTGWKTGWESWKNWSLLVYKSTHKVFSSTICRWRNIFLTGTESVKEAAKSGIAVTVTDKTDVCNVKILLKVIANYRYCQTCLILLLLLLRYISFWSIFCKWGKNTAYIDKCPKQARKQTVWQLLKNI